MAKGRYGRGSGWWREPRPHRDAALKGLENRRKRSRHGRTDNVISPQELERLRNGEKRRRSKLAIGMDERRTAATIYDPRDPKQVKKWRKDPSRADLNGVDTEAQHLFGIKVRATTEVEKRKEVVKRTVEEARKRVKKAREEARTPEEADKAAKDALSTAKDAIAAASREVAGILTGAKEEQEDKIRRFQGKWDPERKRRAEAVAKTVGCSVFEADALIARAKRAGIDYDLVDWDAIQGKDLEFSERVEKLDTNIHKETTTKAEEDHVIDWQIVKAQDEWNEYVKQQEESLQTEAQRIRRKDEEDLMEERDYQISFGDPQEYAENDLYDDEAR